jgi:predicted phage tail protein
LRQVRERNLLSIRGAGGGGGGKGGGGGGASQRVAVEAPNTLRSKNIARVLDVICEGEIVGLVHPETHEVLPPEEYGKAIYFDDTVLQNPDGTFNFEGITVEFRPGLPDQAPLTGFPAGEADKGEGVEITAAAPIVRTITDTNLDAIRLKVRVSSLVSQSASTGDLNPTSVSLKVELQPSGGGYEVVKEDTISGKTTSPYERAYLIPLTGTGPWNYRVTRLTPDSESAALQNKTYLAGYTGIVDHRLIYPDSALCGVAVDAQLFGANVPARGYLMKLLKGRVPSNRDPETRDYDGFWDGTFQFVWHNNPAWVFYELVTNDRWGLGEFLGDTEADKWVLYEIGRYCDEPVPDGLGGMEPRFTFNGVISTQEEAFRVVQALASVFRGMVYWSSSGVTAVQDAPSRPSKLVTQANAVGGLFTYQGTALKTRFTVVNVSFTDPADRYRPSIEVVQDDDAIRRFGRRVTNVVAPWCTSRGQARRMGRWIIDTNLNETKTVTYRAGFDHAEVRPGDVIAVADPARARKRMGGRAKAATSTSLTVDAAVEIHAGIEYILLATLPDGRIEERILTNAASAGETVLTWTNPLPLVPKAFSVWILAGDVQPWLCRVLANVEIERHVFEITALQHSPGKYERVEQNLRLAAPASSTLPQGRLQPPSNLTWNEYTYRQGAVVRSAVTISIQASPDPRARYYEFRVKRPTSPDFVTLATGSTLSMDIDGTEFGLWSFQSRALDAQGRPSNYVTVADVELKADRKPTEDVSGARISVIGPIANITVNPILAPQFSHFWIKFTPETDEPKWGSAVTLLDNIAVTSFQLPAMKGSYLIKAVNTAGVESLVAAVIVSTIDGVEGLNAVELVEGSPDWTGTRDGTAKHDGALRLGSADTVGDWARLGDVIALGAGTNGVRPQGSFDFDEVVELDAVYTSRLTATIHALGVNYGNRIGLWTRLGDVETLGGADPGSWDLQLLVATTQDAAGPGRTWSTWAPFVVGDYTACAFKFRTVLFSYDPQVTPVVDELVIQVDMPDRLVDDYDVPCAPPGVRVDFDPPFRARPSLTFGLQGMQEGDRYTISSHTRTGFNIAFTNGGAPVSRSFDYHAKGYGHAH